MELQPHLRHLFIERTRLLQSRVLLLRSVLFFLRPLLHHLIFVVCITRLALRCGIGHHHDDPVIVFGVLQHFSQVDSILILHVEQIGELDYPDFLLFTVFLLLISDELTW